MLTYLKSRNFRFSAKISFWLGLLYCGLLVLLAFFWIPAQILGYYGLDYINTNPVDDDNFTILGAIFVMPYLLIFASILFSGLPAGVAGFIFGTLGLKSDKRKLALYGIAMSLAALLITLIIMFAAGII